MGSPPTELLLGARVLLTGASGFIGSHLLRRLEVLGARPLPLPGRTLSKELVDARAMTAFVRAMAPDYIFHLAAEIRRGADTSDYYVSNIELTAALLDAARELPGLRRFVHVGTCAEYGSAPSPLHEDGPCRPISLYGESRLEATLMVLDAAARVGTPVTVARPFLTYGPGQTGDLLAPQLFRAVARGEPIDLTPGDQARDVIFVDDVVEALLALACCDGARGEIVNVGSGVARTLRELGAAVLAAYGETRAELLRFGVHPYRAAEPMVFYADVGKLVRLTGAAERTPFPEALARTAAWYKAHAR